MLPHKLLVQLITGILLVTFLNNFMAYIFPLPAQPVIEPYKVCKQFEPKYDIPTDLNVAPDTAKFEAEQEKHEQCIKDNSRKTADIAAMAHKNALVKAVIVLLILVGVTLITFKKYPYYSAGLMLGGLLFVLSYPMFVGIESVIGEYAKLSQSVMNQIHITKMLIGLVGFIALSLADILFFERANKELSDR